MGAARPSGAGAHGRANGALGKPRIAVGSGRTARSSGQEVSVVRGSVDILTWPSAIDGSQKAAMGASAMTAAGFVNLSGWVAVLVLWRTMLDITETEA